MAAKTNSQAQQSPLAKPDKEKVSLDIIQPPPNKMGRPPSKMELLEHNVKVFEHLMEMRPHLEWVAAHFGCDADTIAKFVKLKWGCTFSEFRNKVNNKYRYMLFNTMMDEALNKRQIAALIFASKNLLKWQNHPDEDPEMQEDVDLEFVDPGDPK
jgi:hypothetical protein